MKIGIFGGTFPGTLWPSQISRRDQGKFGLDRIFYSFESAERKIWQKQSWACDGKMAVRIILFRRIDIECQARQVLYRQYPGAALENNPADLYFLLGIDAFLDIPNWREPEKILSRRLYCVSRPGRTQTSSIRRIWA
jgi:nicotinic acid mononucleotide adenylyltransferase